MVTGPDQVSSSASGVLTKATSASMTRTNSAIHPPLVATTGRTSMA